MLTPHIVGLPVAVRSQGGETAVFATFSKECVDPGCAFEFAIGEDRRFRLLQVPTRQGYEAGTIYSPHRLRLQRLEPTLDVHGTTVYRRGRGIDVQLEEHSRR